MLHGGGQSSPLRFSQKVSCLVLPLLLPVQPVLQSSIPGTLLEDCTHNAVLSVHTQPLLPPLHAVPHHSPSTSPATSLNAHHI